jgi:hypothetical protein
MTELRPTQPDGLREPTMCPRRCGGRCGRATRAAARLWARMAGAPSVASWSSITFSRLPTAAGRPRVIFSCAGARTMPMRRRCTLCPRSCERPRLHPTAWLGPDRVGQILSVCGHSLDEGPMRRGSMYAHDADGTRQEARAATRAESTRGGWRPAGGDASTASTRQWHDASPQRLQRGHCGFVWNQRRIGGARPTRACSSHQQQMLGRLTRSSRGAGRSPLSKSCASDC